MVRIWLRSSAEFDDATEESQKIRFTVVSLDLHHRIPKQNVHPCILCHRNFRFIAIRYDFQRQVCE